MDEDEVFFLCPNCNEQKLTFSYSLLLKAKRVVFECTACAYESQISLGHDGTVRIEEYN